MSKQNPIGESVVAVAGGAPSYALEVIKPKECMLALEMLSHGESYSKIGEKTGLSPSNISRLKVRHQGAIEKRRAAAADEFDDIADLYKEALRQKGNQLLTDAESLAKASAKDLSLAAAIGTDKGQQLRGEATTIVEHRKVSLEDAIAAKEAAIERLRSQGKVVDV